MARRKRFELAIMLNIISLSFNIPRDGAKLNVIGRAHSILGLPRRSISKNVSNLLKQWTGLQISESDHFRTRLPQ
jgi:hypothetical protein